METEDVSRAENLRIWLYRHFFTSLSGITTADWARLAAANRFRISPRYWPRAAFITLGAISNSLSRWWEEKKHGDQVRETKVKAPLFILGHWRSGTTHLHNLLSLDPRLAWPTTYEAFYPHTFLTTETSAVRRYSLFMPRHRIVDNLPAGFTTPMEDEFALAVLTGMSPYLGWSFPAREDFYDRYLTFEDVDLSEVVIWQQALRYFLQKLTLKHGRPLVLKSPAHTCRIRWILELFPDAKFVHISRHPYAVYPSMLRLLTAGIDGLYLQVPNHQQIHERLLTRYCRLYDTYFRERSLVPGQQWHELSLESLETDGIGELEKLYAALDLPPLAEVRPTFEKYFASLQSYQKNRFPELDPSIRRDIDREWRPSFEAFGYSTATPSAR